MRRLAVLIVLCLAPVALRAQYGAEPEPAGEHAGHGAEMKAHAAGDVAADWKKVQGHWTMVQGLSGAEKAEHLEMHRTMLDDLMGKLASHGVAAEVKEGQGPTVGDRMEQADREPVEGEREGAMEDAAMAADDEGKTGERIEEERAAEAEAMAGGQSSVTGLADLQEHWAMVADLSDPGQLEEHLAMHMTMLEQALVAKPAGDPEGTTTPDPEPAGHEGKHGEAGTG